MSEEKILEIMSEWVENGKYISHPAFAEYITSREDYIEDIKFDSLRRKINDIYNKNFLDKDILVQNAKLAKKAQRHQDINNAERKALREYFRVENAVSALAIALREELSRHAQELSKINLKPLKKRQSEAVGVAHLTDLHGNELINLPHNRYDFEVLAKRLKLYVNDSSEYFDYMGVNKILLVLGGDLLNSDRRKDEKLNQATNRAKASILMQHLLKQVILEYRNRGFRVDIVSVLGNEARIGDEMPFSQEGLSDNYDFLIGANLKTMFEFAKIDGVNFLSVDQVECVVRVGNQNWLVAHDVTKMTNKQEKTQSTIGRYSLSGIVIHFILGGHIHAMRVTDYSARSGSISGSNSYNETALNLIGRASHNAFVVKDDRRFTLSIDLQNTEGISGYEVVRELEAYNAKSAKKIHVPKTIFEVVV